MLAKSQGVSKEVRKLEVHKKLWMYTGETADPNPSKGFPHHMTCWACKAVGWRKKVHSELWCLSSQVRDLLSWRWLNNFLLMGSEFLSFCTLTLPIHFPIPLWGVRKLLCGVELPARVKSQPVFFTIPLPFHKWFSSLHFIEEKLPFPNHLSLVLERKTDSVLKGVLSK